MKDGTRELTNNQWLLKADADKLPATYAELVTLLTGAGLPFGRTLLSDGWTIEPDPLNKANLLKDVTAGLYGLTSTAMVDDALKLAAPKMLLQSYTTAGTYTWTAPDRNGGGAPCEIFAIVVGGGGSGGAICFRDNVNYEGAATGGGSGYPRFFTMTVTPGHTYAVVVGSGGAKVTATSPNAMSGYDGGTSSFDGNTTRGGSKGTAIQGSYATLKGSDGGQPSDSVFFTAPYILPYGGKNPTGIDVPGGYSISQGTLGLCVNPFTGDIILAAGGNVIGQSLTNVSAYCQVAPFIFHDGLIAGSAKNEYNATSSVACVDPTLSGAGGGACSNCGTYYSGLTASSGRGADGCILIYG